MRNNQTQRFSQRQALRLHQGLVTSTAEQVAPAPARLPPRWRPAADRPPLCVCVQVMERLCVRVQQQVCALRAAGDVEEVQAAKQVLKEARNSRAVSTGPACAAGFCPAAVTLTLCLLQALPLAVRAGSRAVCGRSGAAEAGLSGR